MNKPNDPQQDTTNDPKQQKPKVTKGSSESAKTTSTTTKTASKSSTKPNQSLMVAGLALVVAIIGCAGAGYTYWQVNNQNNLLTEHNNSLTAKLTAQQQQFEQSLQQFTTNAERQESSITSQLNDGKNSLRELANDTAKVKASQQSVLTQIAKLNTDSSQTWMLFEAKQLLKQAFFRLRASDINGAAKLLDDVNETIKQRGDLSQAASQINQTIETALLKLQQVEQIDRANLYSQLAAVQTQIADLKVKQPVFQRQDATQNASPDRWDMLFNKLSNYVRVDFNANSKVLPILTSQGFGQLKMTLNLAIEKAQWAALNGEATIYSSELSRINELLEQYFDVDSTEVKALMSKVEQLKTKTIITQTPDITEALQAVNNYLDEQIAAHTPTRATNQTGGNAQ